jgi:iron complex transport system ATP-binding protein
MAEPEPPRPALALRARSLSVALSGKPVLHALDCDAEFGTVTAVLGPNGAGKSTLLRALSGLLPSSGQVLVQGRPLETLSARERSRTLAFVPQRSLLDARLPVWSVVSHGRFAHRIGMARLSAADLKAIDSALHKADVAHLAEREFPELSHGEQRRVLLARALATEARVLLLDEPAAALDIPHALALYALLRALCREGRCVIAVMHQLDDALRFTDRALLIHEGRLVAAGASADVISAQNVARVYGVELVPGGALAFRLGGTP